MKIKAIEIVTRSEPHFRPVVIMNIDLENLQGKISSKITGFNARLIKLLPDLNSHYCDLGQMGGFVQRLHDGTHLNHVIEHIAIELLAKAGYDCRDERLCGGDENDDSKVVIETTKTEMIRSVLPMAGEIAEALTTEKSNGVEVKITKAIAAS